jgi:hypothetical protein
VVFVNVIQGYQSDRMRIKVIGGQIFRALTRARFGILTIAITYIIFIVIGIWMVHARIGFALAYRDNLIARADAADPSLIALHSGDRLKAALWDFSRNLFAGVADTGGGMGVVFPYPFVAYRGWVGGIVSIDDNHTSRLSDPYEAGYYLFTLLLQLIPYSLAGGVGVNLGIASFRPRPFYRGEKLFSLPKEAIWDVFRVYVLIVPLFLVASLWEFFLR